MRNNTKALAVLALALAAALHTAGGSSPTSVSEAEAKDDQPTVVDYTNGESIPQESWWEQSWWSRNTGSKVLAACMAVAFLAHVCDGWLNRVRSQRTVSKTPLVTKGPGAFRNKAQDEIAVKSKIAVSVRRDKRLDVMEKRAKMYGVTQGNRLGDAPRDGAGRSADQADAGAEGQQGPAGGSAQQTEIQAFFHSKKNKARAKGNGSRKGSGSQGESKKERGSKRPNGEAPGVSSGDVAGADGNDGLPSVSPHMPSRYIPEQVLRQRRATAADAALRREQDLEYERSLDADRQKAADVLHREREEEEARLQVDREEAATRLADEQRRAAEELQRVAEERKRSNLQQQIGGEPPEDGTAHCTILIKLPTGSTLRRRWAPSATVQHLLQYVEYHGFPPDKHCLATTYPRRVLDDASLTLDAAGLTGRATVHCQAL